MTEEWIQYKLSFEEKDPIIIEILSDILMSHGGVGIEVDYAQDYLDNHPNLFGEIAQELPDSILNHPTEILAYFENEVDEESLSRQIIESYLLEKWDLSRQIIEREDWHSNWMVYFKPEKMSRFLTIVPLWENYQAQENEQLVYIDPGAAFGTGNHETTRLSAQALELVMQSGERVLDVGTGTGILSFIAAAFGASQVYGYDLDPQAIDAAKSNLAYQEKNPKIKELIDSNKIDFSVNNLLKGVDKPADIIVANILPHILVDLFEDAYKLLSDDGYLIIGGILSKKGDFIEEEIAKRPFTIDMKMEKKGWLNYILKKEEID